MSQLSARLEAGPRTVHWGVFSADIPPKLKVESGAIVEISALTGGPAEMPDDPSCHVPEPLRQIHAKMEPKLPGHVCTGPVEVAGAEPGDVLQVDILSIELDWDWGFMFVRPMEGALPYEFSAPKLIHPRIDRDAGSIRLPFGAQIPAAPFFGVMAVAPPAEWGELSTIQPRRNGGNLDNKMLVAGSTLYLPIHVAGANFSVGDGHGAQGDGEVCVTAIETALTGRFRLTVRNDLALEWPMAETAEAFITMGFDESLEAATRIAVRNMVDLIAHRAGVERMDAYFLASVAADLRLTQVVNGQKGVHMVLPKTVLQSFNGTRHPGN